MSSPPESSASSSRNRRASSTTGAPPSSRPPNPYHLPPKSSPLAGQQASDDTGETRLLVTKTRRDGERRTVRSSSQGMLRTVQARDGTAAGTPQGTPSLNGEQGKGKQRSISSDAEPTRPSPAPVQAHHQTPPVGRTQPDPDQLPSPSTPSPSAPALRPRPDTSASPPNPAHRKTWFGWGSAPAEADPSSPQPLATSHVGSVPKPEPILATSEPDPPASQLPPPRSTAVTADPMRRSTWFGSTKDAAPGSEPAAAATPAPDERTIAVAEPTPAPIPNVAEAPEEASEASAVAPPRTWYEVLTLRPAASTFPALQSSADADAPLASSQPADNGPEPAPEPPSEPTQPLAMQRKRSWWGWGSPVPEEEPPPDSAMESSSAPAAAPLTQPSSVPIAMVASGSPNADTSPAPADSSRWGSWVTGWYGGTVTSPHLPAPDTPRISATAPVSPALGPRPSPVVAPASAVPKDLYNLPNPVLQTLPSTSKGWASFFSSRRNVPQRLIEGPEAAARDDVEGEESMVVDFSLDGPPPGAPTAPESAKASKSVQASPIKGKLQSRSSSRAPSLNAPLGASPQTSPILAAVDAGGRKTSIRRPPTSPPPSSPKVPPGGQPGKQQPEPPHSRPATPLTGGAKDGGVPKEGGKSGPKPFLPNLVLPTFADTFSRPPRSFPPRQSILQKTVSAVSSYFFSTPPPLSTATASGAADEREKKRRIKEAAGKTRMEEAGRLPKSLETMGLSPAERRRTRLGGLKKVVVLAVRGWATSSPFVRSMIGEPTASSKFAEMMAAAVSSYLSSELSPSSSPAGPVLNPDALVVIPLEGEGRVDDRVEILYKQIQRAPEWTAALKEADAVFVVAHSQGSVVSAKLLARLAEKGEVKSEHVTFLSMCGVWNGPFVGLSQSYALQPYFQYVEGPAARELFEFQDPNAAVSQNAVRALRTILDAGAKVLLVASLNDQVVPIYSALFSAVSHPSIVRAIFIDAAAFRSSDFLANLVVFCSRLRNAGITDHNLPIFLSEALAGSLTGVGHSLIYDEKAVFELAVRYFFETTSPRHHPTVDNPLQSIPALELQPYNPRERLNPYYLPWALRGILEDRQVQELFGSELDELRRQYDEWKPVTKVLRDVRFKLEPLTAVSQIASKK